MILKYEFIFLVFLCFEVINWNDNFRIKKIIVFCGGIFFFYKYCDEICVGVVLFCDVWYKSNWEKIIDLCY